MSLVTLTDDTRHDKRPRPGPRARAGKNEKPMQPQAHAAGLFMFVDCSLFLYILPESLRFT